MVDHAKLAADAPDATDAIKLHAGHVQIAGENTRVRVQDIHDRADKIGEAGGISDTQQDVLKILALTQQTIQGVDTNLDEQVGPIPGEGGVITAYQHAQLMAGVPLAASAAKSSSHERFMVMAVLSRHQRLDKQHWASAASPTIISTPQPQPTRRRYP